MQIGFVLMIIAFVLIPVMLLVKPCCFRGDGGHEDEHDEIEFTNINNRDGEQQPNPQIQRGSAEPGGSTDDAMKKRHDEMKSLEKQI